MVHGSSAPPKTSDIQGLVQTCRFELAGRLRCLLDKSRRTTSASIFRLGTTRKHKNGPAVVLAVLTDSAAAASYVWRKLNGHWQFVLRRPTLRTNRRGHSPFSDNHCRAANFDAHEFAAFLTRGSLDSAWTTHLNALFDKPLERAVAEALGQCAGQRRASRPCRRIFLHPERGTEHARVKIASACQLAGKQIQLRRPGLRETR